jgi:hypothetical protein
MIKHVPFPVNQLLGYLIFTRKQASKQAGRQAGNCKQASKQLPGSKQASKQVNN